MLYASTIDLEEAYQVGFRAVEIAAAGQNGYMATILRRPGDFYAVTFERVSLEDVANSERLFPPSWISASQTDVTDAFVRYAMPLIGHDWPAVPVEGSLQRFARLEPIFAAQVLPGYVPQTYRQQLRRD
jgi:6-phosphofructokinase 1